ncbi:MAG: (5-formylfuran-3-yl)methyl phosphate synthase [Pirellulales bacterium]
MTRLLVSVRSLEEARLAAAAGVAVIDLKEPGRGSLGRVSLPVAVEVAGALGPSVTLSMALGELAQWSHDDWELIRRLPAEVRFAKIGLAGWPDDGDWRSSWREALSLLPGQTAPVAVIYADWQDAAAPQPDRILSEAIRNQCRALLVDTFRKDTGNVFCHAGTAQLADWFRVARGSKMLTVLAGSLRLDDLDTALALEPDYLAVRGAVCRSSRQHDLCPTKLSDWVRRLASRSPASGTRQCAGGA